MGNLRIFDASVKVEILIELHLREAVASSRKAPQRTNRQKHGQSEDHQQVYQEDLITVISKEDAQTKIHVLDEAESIC